MKNKSRILAAQWLVLMMSAAYAQDAHATYSFCGTNTLANRHKRSSSTVALKAFPQDFSVNGSPTSYYIRIAESAAAWNALPGSNVNFTLAMDDENVDEDWGVGSSGEDQIYRVNAAHPSNWTMGTFATWTSTCGAECCNGVPQVLREADIEVYSKYTDAGGNLINLPWSDAIAAPALFTETISTNPVYFPVSLQHELGHALGIRHSNGHARMESHYIAGGWFDPQGDVSNSNFSLFPNDGLDAAALYPDSTTGANIYFTQFKHLGVQAPVDTVPNTFLLSAKSNGQGGVITGYWPRRSAGALPNHPSVRDVRVGDIVETSVCWGNRGPSQSSTFTVTGKLSSDALWSTSGNDVSVGTWAFPVQPGWAVGCDALTFVVPAGTPLGSYYILHSAGNNADEKTVSNLRITVVCSTC